MSYITLRLDERRKVDEVGFQSRPRPEVENMYDRSHDLFHFISRPFSIQASDVQGKKMDLILAREPFVWPDFEDKLHVTARFRGKGNMAHDEKGGLRVFENFPADAFDPATSILALTTSLRRHHTDMHPAFGAIVLGHQAQRHRDFVLTIDRLTFDRYSPKPLVGLFKSSEVHNVANLSTQMAAQSKPDRTFSFNDKTAGIVQVTARCVIVSGEPFWSIDVFQDLDE
jgi:hypothetical protein